MEQHKFNIGDKVRFKVEEDSNCIPDYTYRGLTGVEHGSRYFRKNEGIIKDIQGKYYMVEYFSNDDAYVRLGFEANVLECITPAELTFNFEN